MESKAMDIVVRARSSFLAIELEKIDFKPIFFNIKQPL
jgi:hypothetical protein